MKRIFSLLALLALAAPARADLLQGQVVDQFGFGVPGVDIDVKNLGSGGTPPIFNDGTDANGFFSTTMPAGIYRVTFNPPPPPAASSLVLEIDDVVVVGTKQMGVVQLPAAVALSGRILNASQLPVAGVNLDVIDLTSGDNLIVPADTTDLFGQFSIAVPPGPIELRMDATTVPLQTLASQSMKLTPAGATDLGDLTLPPGFAVSARVLGPGGVPVQNADVDVFDSATATKVFTPKDNTSATGDFSVVIPAGTWDVMVCPQFSSLIVAVEIDSVPVAAGVDLGTLNLQAGVVLSGNVKSWQGVNVANADVDVMLSSTGATVALCGDNTTAAGNFAVVVPTGTLDVRFAPPGFSMPLAAQTQTVVVAGNQVLNGTLPACAFNTPYGAGNPGTGGFVPALTTSGGAPRLGNPGYAFEITDGIGGGLAFVAMGFGPFNLPLFNGTLLIDITKPTFSFFDFLGGAAGVGGAGSLSMPFPFPIEDKMIGLTAYFQVMTLDAANVDEFNPFGVTFGNAVSVTFCD